MGGVSGNKAAKRQGAQPEVILPGGHGVIFTPRRCHRSVHPAGHIQGSPQRPPPAPLPQLPPHGKTEGYKS